MNRAVLLVGAAAMALAAAGCGSKDREMERLRSEQKRGLDQMQEQVAALAAQVRQLREDVRELDSDLFDLRGAVDFGLAAVGRAGEAGPGTETAPGPGTEGGTSSGVATGEEVPIEPIQADSLEALAAEVAKLRADVTRLRDEFTTERETAELRDPRRTWEAMNDPKQLNWRLDRFAARYAPTIKDETARAEFVADVARYEEELSARAALSSDQLRERYRAKLTERVNTETNERMRNWFEQQLRTLETGQPNVVENQLQTFLRYDAVEELKDLATKNKISNEELRDNGLQIYGGAYGWR